MEQHRELELMNSFRERFGHHWLQYRNHLEASGTHVLVTSETPALSTQPPDAPSAEPTADPLPPDQEPPQEVAEEVRVEPEPQEEEEVEEQGKEDGGKEEEEEQEQNEVQGEHSVAVEGAGGGWVVAACLGVRRAGMWADRPLWDGGPESWLPRPIYRVPLWVSLQWSSVAPCWCVPWRGPKACVARSAFSGSLLATCSRWNSRRLEPWNGLSSRVWRQLR